jgi:phospholipid/cholesterol/gamma-HCH transport system substrate-binding protein
MTARPNLSTQVRVGLFVTIGMIIATFSLFTVGGEDLLKKQSIIYSHFDSVQGLAEGSVVSLAGIKIGNIHHLSFSENNGKIQIAMRVETSSLSRITEGSTIEVRTAGALGDKFLYITPGPISDRSLQPEGVIETSQASDLMSVLSEKGGEAERVFDIMKESQILLRTLNQENRIEKILSNLSQSTAELKIAAQDARLMMSGLKDQNASQKIVSSVEKLDRILTKIDRGDGTLGALVNDSSLHESLKNFVNPSEKKKSIKTLIRSSIESSESRTKEKSP